MLFPSRVRRGYFIGWWLIREMGFCGACWGVSSLPGRWCRLTEYRRTFVDDPPFWFSVSEAAIVPPPLACFVLPRWLCVPLGFPPLVVVSTRRTTACLFCRFFLIETSRPQKTSDSRRESERRPSFVLQMSPRSRKRMSEWCVCVHCVMKTHTAEDLTLCLRDISSNALETRTIRQLVRQRNV